MRRGLKLEVLWVGEVERETARKRLPDEKGIETHSCITCSLASAGTRKRLPDEKGIETY